MDKDRLNYRSTNTLNDINQNNHLDDLSSKCVANALFSDVLRFFILIKTDLYFMLFDVVFILLLPHIPFIVFRWISDSSTVQSLNFKPIFEYACEIDFVYDWKNCF